MRGARLVHLRFNLSINREKADILLPSRDQG